MISTADKNWQSAFGKFTTKIDRLVKDNPTEDCDIYEQKVICPMESVIQNLQMDMERLELKFLNRLEGDSIPQFGDIQQPTPNATSEDDNHANRNDHTSTPLSQHELQNKDDDTLTNQDNDVLNSQEKQQQQKQEPLRTDNDNDDASMDTRNDGNKNHKRLKKTLIFMDSNRKLLKIDELWRNSTLITCNNIQSFMSLIDKTDFSNVDLVLAHFGVNDIDTKDGTAVANDIQTAIQALKLKAAHVRIVLSEITPRMDDRNSHVKTCNKQLHSYANSMGITLAKHSNLDAQEFLRDAKHFHETKISLFASNLKSALRSAIGFVRTNPSGRYGSRNNGGRNNKGPNNFSSKEGGKGGARNNNADMMNQFMNFLRKFK